jgi:outer membrane lipoprotein-sorting protein
MTKMLQRVAVAAVLMLSAVPALAQTADEIIEKHLAATGGREALAKLTSRVSTGTIALTSPVGELKGTVEQFNKKPNKTRTLIKLDLSAVGAGSMVSDQRFDGNIGYVLDSLNGNREITGDQLEAMRIGSFPTPLLNYKDAGSTLQLTGREKVGAGEAYVLQLKAKIGPAVRLYIDAQSFMLVKTATTINVPQFGGPIEQVVEFSDFREVDGIKLAHGVKSSNALQTVISTVTEVKHNTEIDDSSFSKPAQ